ncbi:MAG: hypothetical protein JRD05_00120 [Deltaproteobacteria bacterium]|nr:hypothetical protein [Deltaproteobacteria bacterium]
MITSNIDTSYLLRQPSEKYGGEKPGYIVEDETKEKEPDIDEYILCRQCLQVITSPAERIEMQGAHQHTFANPNGIVYQIGCFRSASGCGYAGQPSYEFSWFKGYSWRVAVCGSCLFHLGWLFTSPGSESFNGLILDHLIQPG